MLSTVKERKSKECIMPSRDKRSNSGKQKTSGIVCDAKPKKCLKISVIELEG